jgi:hypothetical protein
LPRGKRMDRRFVVSGLLVVMVNFICTYGNPAPSYLPTHYRFGYNILWEYQFLFHLAPSRLQLLPEKIGCENASRTRYRSSLEYGSREMGIARRLNTSPTLRHQIQRRAAFLSSNSL